MRTVSGPGSSRRARAGGRAILPVVLVAIACGEREAPVEPPRPPEPPRATSVTVTPESATLVSLGETISFTASIVDQHGRPYAGTVEWTSSDPTVFTVDAGGTVTAVSNGSGTVAAAFEGLSAAASVAVEQAPASLETVSGADQRAPAGTALREPVVVRVADAGGSPIAEAAIAFTPGAGHGTADPAEAASDAAGLARTVWTLGPAVGVQTLEAAVNAAGNDASALVTATANNPDRAALEAFYHATGGPGWANDDNWLTDASLETWHGIHVDETGRVVLIDMHRNGLTGAVPPEIGDLSSLETLSFTANPRLTGIPAEIGRLARLDHLSFANTGLTSVPPELGDLHQLDFLSLASTRLTSLPPVIGNLSSLTYLDLRDNEFTSLPPELENLVRLRILTVSDNRLAGAAPLELMTNLTELVSLQLDRNELAGAIPPELGGLARLARLDLSSNQLEGAIPPELGGLASLTWLNLASNNLEGAIPPELGHLTSLVMLRLSKNAALSGPLPASLSNLLRLDELWAGGTDLCAPDSLREWLSGLTHRLRTCRDASASAAYLTQAVQSLEFPVPLVADEPALLRVFPVAPNAAGQRLPPARALFFHRDQEVHRVDIPAPAGALTGEVDESSLSSSLNAEIPAEVIQPGLEMVVEIDPDGTLDPSLGLDRRVPAEGRSPVAVRAPPALDLTLIPFLSTTNPDSSILDRTDGLTPEDPLFRGTHTLLPVREIDLTIHEPVETSAGSPGEIMGEVIAIRAMEGATGHYMGTIAGLSSGIGGLAVTGGRVTYAVLDPDIMAHELGHNFSLRHAPCRASALDPFFPQEDGSIGSWGYDFAAGALVSPERTYDLMSYCDPAWISDYSFKVALDYRLAESATGAAAPAPAILIWGGVEADGTPFLEPALAVRAPPSLPHPGGGGYTIIGAADDGRHLFSLEFTMPTLADGDGGSRFAFALPAMPDWTALASITLSGNERSFTLDGEGGRAVAVVRDLATRQVRAVLRSGGAPEFGAAALRDRAAALSALRPGLEVLFSRGIPDLAAAAR